MHYRFELFEGGQLHIDMDEDWQQTIKHYHVSFKPFDKLMSDVSGADSVNSWPRPLTIEHLEERWHENWSTDLTSVCWQATERGELGGGRTDSAPNVQGQQI